MIWADDQQHSKEFMSDSSDSVVSVTVEHTKPGNSSLI
jgi:hypothetical protein